MPPLVQRKPSPPPNAVAERRPRVNHEIALSPTILRVMDNYVSLQFDRRLVEQLYRQRPSLPRPEAPELSELFGLFDALVNEVWNADAEVGVTPDDDAPRLSDLARPGARE